ncbi:hypothetical protein FHS26_004413 [Rhizobium pisi]|uniref:Uncharacterized protein n=2 Tax=Rhizobium/Agrobacterium group TaxID=227290 RepID=A0A4R0CVF8_9HYPH|nr:MULTISPECIES: hypothetical protein [Rhizobium]MBB3136656.1 hypothetical protein [Rhizobium pisi]MBY5530104.1 hypothetical protein [Rhizobium leguminosarum]NEH49761.1 hypothetical protein [Rhizobium leguminosarum]NEH57709.1 hypothetical protein [Rhizobium leguminosarum]NKK29708.1 hypothetical protein [Rhizobium leguminosarum bv. viciae]
MNAELLPATSSSGGLHKEHDDMDHQKKSDKRLGYSHLRLATIDGVSLPGLQLSLDRQEGSVSTKKTFFEQLLLDFAFGCYLFYPIQLYEHPATSERTTKALNR